MFHKHYSPSDDRYFSIKILNLNNSNKHRATQLLASISPSC